MHGAHLSHFIVYPLAQHSVILNNKMHSMLLYFVCFMRKKSLKIQHAEQEDILKS